MSGILDGTAGMCKHGPLRVDPNAFPGGAALEFLDRLWNPA
jgi:hypothetical protein